MAKGSHLSRQRRLTAQYATQIDELYKEAAREAAALGVSLDAVLSDDKIFSFDDYPRAKKRVNALLQQLNTDMRTVVENGIEASWQLANEKNDELATSILGKRLVSKLSDEQKKRYFSNNADALAAFRGRKDSGLTLSDRVWNYTNQFKTEVELALDVGLGQVKSADELSRDVRQYLKYPDKLFRRVRDKHGTLKLSKAAAAFHPGRGVYRSSYKNARRLTATECNMAYRAADYERWQTMDFVVGIRIVLSNNHEEDICDDLKGDYPKTFKFTGWHPHCRCHVETILKTTAEMQADTERIKAGDTPATGSVNEVKELPSQFTAWAQDNKDRILEAQGRGSLPYFLRDNWSAVDSIFNPKPKKLTALEMADKRTGAAIAAGEGATPATLQQLEEAISRYEYTNGAYKRQEKSVIPVMKELLNNNDFGMEIKHEYLESVFEKGFLNTFQTGTSEAYIESNRTTGLIETDNIRLLVSHKMFAPKGFNRSRGRLGDELTYNGKQFERREYEKYGYLLDRNKTDSFLYNKAGYGDVQVRFKKDKVKATWTFDDSLHGDGSYFQPSLTSDPRVESFDDRVWLSPDALKQVPREKLYKWQQKVRTDYIELQYHGDLPADCIESLTFPKHPLKLHTSSFVKKMIDAGVELWYMDEKSHKVVRYVP